MTELAEQFDTSSEPAAVALCQATLRQYEALSVREVQAMPLALRQALLYIGALVVSERPDYNQRDTLVMRQSAIDFAAKHALAFPTGEAR